MNNLHLYNLVKELADYIIANDYVEPKIELSKINSEILNSWGDRFQKAIVEDFISAFQNIKLAFMPSLFELEAENEQGSPSIFLQHVVLKDKENNESLKVIVKTLIFFDKISIYLDSEYANVDNLQSSSKTLNNIFLRLKEAEKSLGYFSPISFKDFICNLD